MAYDVVAVPGDGIGPEVVRAAMHVLDCTGVDIRWQEHPAGEAGVAAAGDPLPDATRAAVREVGVVLKGPMANTQGGYASPNIGLRHAAGVTVNVRVGRAFPGVPGVQHGADLVVVRDVTEDIYCGPQHMMGPDVAMGVKFITRAATHRVARFAFDYARRHQRRKVTVVHKAGTLKKTDGLFLDAAREIAEEYPDIECDDDLIDALAFHVIRKPREYDVFLAPFQYGDIFADICAALTGGLGLMPGASFGDDAAFFEAAHGSAPKYAGQNVVNPTALILSGAMLLDHLGETAAARDVEQAVARVIGAGRHVTYDLGGRASTTEMAEAVGDAMTERAGVR